MIKDLIVKLEDDTSLEASRDYAMSIARCFDARLVGVAFAYELILPPYVVAELPADIIVKAIEEREKAAHAAVDRFEEAAKRNLLHVEHRLYRATPKAAPIAFSTLARRFTLSVLIQAAPQDRDSEDMIEASLFDSGRPVCIVPFGEKNMRLDRVVCCWDGSRVAARAFNDALPFLTRASEVDLLIVVNEKTRMPEREIHGVDMGKHLAGYGIKVAVKTVTAPDSGAAKAILAYVADSSATMIVMGGYGHSRLREFVLGGVTRGILSDLTVPVLMSH
jgi:nucleotide-binding universal stress UspA family protein